MPLLLQSKKALAGSCLVLLVVLCALLAPLLAPYDPNAQELSNRLRPPAWMRGGASEHLLGTDHLGRDVLSRIIYGARISLLVAAVAVLISGTLGTLLGLLAGYKGGPWEYLIMLVADIQLAFPFILLALAIMAVLGTGLKNVILVLSVTGWVAYGRLVRGQVLSLKSTEFIEAARALGQKESKILFGHILPNVLSSLPVMAGLRVAGVIVAEASLTFLGLGVEPDIATWGGMLADGRDYIMGAWWLTTFPGLAIMLTVLGTNLITDRLRDLLDPRSNCKA